MPVLLVAYNKRLELDMSEQRNSRVPAELRSLIEVRTIHGFGHRYFDDEGLTSDKQLDAWTKSRKTPTRTLPSYGLVIIDEAQDLTPTLYEFLHYVISLLPVRPQLLILGDPFQVLYGYLKANVMYLVNAQLHFGLVVKDAPFKHVRLSICFRISHEMADWINTNLNPMNLRYAQQEDGWFEKHKEILETWWADGIRANPSRPRDPDSFKFFRRSDYFPMYGGYNAEGATIDVIQSLLSEHDIEKTVILGLVITESNYNPVRLITNQLRSLQQDSCPWYIDGGPKSNEVDENVRKNKRLASTIHRFKGRESDGVVLLGLDGFYESKSKRDPLSLFNKLYVGATRARKQLLIVEWSDVSYCTVRLPARGEIREEVTPSATSVPRLLMHCPYERILCDESPQCLTSTIRHTIEALPFRREDYIVPGAHHGKQRYTVEDVSLVLSVGIMVRLQLYLDEGDLECPDLIDVPEEEKQNVPPSLRRYLSKIQEEAKTKREYSWPEVLQIALAFLTTQSLYFYRWRQTDLFHRWQIVRSSHKLDLAVNNLVELLYEPFCNNELDFSQVRFEQKLGELRLLRRNGRLVLNERVSYDLVGFPKFFKRYGILVGDIAIALLSPADAKRRADQIREREKARRGKDAALQVEEQTEHIIELGEELEEEPVKIVQVSASSKMTDDERLEIGCYGSMYTLSPPFVTPTPVNMSVLSQKIRSKEYKPKLYIAYPTQGRLVSVEQHMSAFEFIHRMGYRKVNEEFDERILVHASTPCPIGEVYDNVLRASSSSEAARNAVHRYVMAFGVQGSTPK